MRREVLTAKSLSRNLKDHEEAFKSRNGYEVEPPPEEDSDVSGIIAKFVLLETVSDKAVRQAGTKIRDITERSIKYMQGVRMIYNALGYRDLQEALKANPDPEHVINRNYGRRDPGGVAHEITDAKKEAQDKAVELLTPYFEEVNTWEETDFFNDVMIGAGFPGQNQFYAAAIQYVDKMVGDRSLEDRLALVCVISRRYRAWKPERRKCARVYWIGEAAVVYLAAKRLGAQYWPNPKGRVSQ